jgi:hypothetical protein
MRSTWRDICRPIIYEVINSNPDLNEKDLKREISKAYPFGERRMHPYKIWLSEVKKQLKISPKTEKLVLNQKTLF